jgi:hypothetical protein
MYERFASDGALSLGPFSSTSPDIYSDESLKPNKQGSALDLDTSRPQADLDSNFSRQTFAESAYEDNLPLDPPKNKVTYDELRSQNRAEFEKKQQNPFNRLAHMTHLIFNNIYRIYNKSIQQTTTS